MSNMLAIGGVSAEMLAEKMGTPLYVYDEARIAQNLADFRRLFVSDVLETQVIYASKAFTCGAMLDLVRESGCSLEVVSGGELHCAGKSGFPMEKVYFHGNNKTPEELTAAFDKQIAAIIVDNAEEGRAIIALAAKRKQTVSVFLRLNPGVEAHTHKYIVTAQPGSKFGMGTDRRHEILKLLREFEACGYVRFEGFHAHIGSQIFDKAAFAAEIRSLAEFAGSLEKEDGVRVDAFNLGGGFAAYYTREDAPIPIGEVCDTILRTCEEEKSRRGLSLKRLFIEPGRSIVAEAGCTLYRVGYRKVSGDKSYVFVDGGMADNIRPALYQAKYRCDLANRLGEAPAGSYTVAGKCCESGDVLIEDAPLPEPRTGDLLVVYTTGAYGYSMASNYNRLGRPPVVFVRDGKARCVIRRETFEDMGQLEADYEI